MRTKIIAALTMVSLSCVAQAPFTNIFLPGTWPSETWWTNSPPPTAIPASNAWQAVNENFGRASNVIWTIEGQFIQAIGTDIPGMISDALSGSGFLTDNQTITLSGDATGSGQTSITVTTTNIQPPQSGSVGQVLTRTTTGVGYSNAPTTLANSPRVLSWSTNLLYVAAGTTNVLGWITNYAGSSVVGTNCATNLTTGGLYILGNPSVLGSTDGTNWWEASQFTTNAAIKIAVSAEPSSAGRNPPVPVPVDSWLTNLTLYALSLPGTFGQTNSLFGQHLYVSDPISGTEAASKQYVDNLFGVTAWWSAANDVQLNGNSLNWNNDWSSRTNYPSTNSATLQFQYYGNNQLQLSSAQPTVVGQITNIWSTQGTNIWVLIATNGITQSPVLQGSHYLVPLNWSYVATTSNSYPSYVTNGSTWGYLIKFIRPFADRFYVRSAITSTNQPAVMLAGLPGLPTLTITSSNSTTWGYGAGYACADTNYFYLSVGTNLWKRTALSSW